MVVRVSGDGPHGPCPRASQSHSLEWGQLPGVTEPLCNMQTPPFPGQVTSEHVMPQSPWTWPLPVPQRAVLYAQLGHFLGSSGRARAPFSSVDSCLASC